MCPIQQISTTHEHIKSMNPTRFIFSCIGLTMCLTFAPWASSFFSFCHCFYSHWIIGFSYCCWTNTLFSKLSHSFSHITPNSIILSVICKVVWKHGGTFFWGGWKWGIHMKKYRSNLIQTIMKPWNPNSFIFPCGALDTAPVPTHLNPMIWLSWRCWVTSWPFGSGVPTQGRGLQDSHS